MRRRGKTGRITGLACATPAPVSFFRSRQALDSLKTKNHPIRSVMVIKCMCRGVESVRLKSYLVGAPSTMSLKSIVTGRDDHNQRQVQCQPLSGVAGRS